jgi:pre-rRNA-processing protein TSR1
VTLVLAAVPAAAASAVLERVSAFASGAAAPLTAFGLMQHESKLSVVNFSLRKAAGFADAVGNKEELLFVTGLRGFVARPVLSGDDHRADKHKMERFLHTGALPLC